MFPMCLECAVICNCNFIYIYLVLNDDANKIQVADSANI